MWFAVGFAPHRTHAYTELRPEHSSTAEPFEGQTLASDVAFRFAFGK